MRDTSLCLARNDVLGLQTRRASDAGRPAQAAPAPWPELREELRLHRAGDNPDGSPAWHVDDPVANRYCRIGWLEFEMLVRWHLGDAAQIAAQIRADTALLSDGREIDADMVIMSIGVRPDTKLAVAAGLDLGPRGGIKVDDQKQTTDPHIYAVGGRGQHCPCHQRSQRGKRHQPQRQPSAAPRAQAAEAESEARHSRHGLWRLQIS